ncbi:RNA recognition motif domain-containing protein [Coralloluteibacterium thermophilus]|uniref:RNA recognition motif domain-containing protein n=1 Tax=Coralloluteibacterium thermophilum TaxID=2707049 RepID=A0ABV9NIZ3_9GAMM
MLTLNVRGLPRSMNEKTLTELFAAHGRVRGLKMAKDLFSGECKGFAELQMEGHEARNAIAALNGSSQDGELIRVELASERRARGRR